jgi:hypothetical protein
MECFHEVVRFEAMLFVRVRPSHPGTSFLNYQ